MSDKPWYYWWLRCEHGCTLWLEAESKKPPLDWATLKCRYDGSALKAFYPQDVTS